MKMITRKNHKNPSMSSPNKFGCLSVNDIFAYDSYCWVCSLSYSRSWDIGQFKSINVDRQFK